MKRWLWIVTGALLAGCHSAPDLAAPVNFKAPKAPPVPSPVQWTDVTPTSGVKFQHNNGAFGLKLMPETMGSGCVFADFNGDGRADIFLVNGRDWTNAEIVAYREGNGREHQQKYGFVAPTPKKRGKTTGALFLNNGDGTFKEATRGSGLDVEMQGMGAVAGDYDNDGLCDLFVTSLGRNYLFRNEGKGRFRDVTQRAGVGGEGWSTSAAWLDYDRDGYLDLFVCHYVDWAPSRDVYRHPNSTTASKSEKSYAGPDVYGGTLNRLYRNLGEGRFADVSATSGVQKATQFSGVVNRKLFGRTKDEARRAGIKKPRKTKLLGKSLGVAVSDYDRDGWPDIIVANDTEPTFLLQNNRNGTFADVAVKVGMAADEAANARGGMGIDAADVDHTGFESIIIGYYADQLIGLYHNIGGAFEDKAAYAEMGRPGLSFVIFGSVFSDIDNDSWPDVLTTNGHVMDDIRKERENLSHEQRPLVFLNRRRKDLKFDEVGLQSGPAMARPIVGRGLACADYDLDGDADLLVTSNGGPAYLLRNEGGNKNHFVRVVLQGTRSNRDGIGAMVQIKTNTATLLRTVRSGSSYLSQSELPLTVGLGAAARLESLTVTWPSGAKTRLSDVPIDSMLVINEARGLLRTKKLRPNQK
jgi:enediyne biosynthesis protein E4